MSDRRNFLKIFGVTAAAVPAVSLAGEEMHVENEVTAKPITPPYIDSSHMYDVQSAQLYSAIETNDGRPVSRLQFFSYGCGDPVDWKPFHRASLADTNMHRAGALVQPEKFCVEEIGLVFSPASNAAERSRFIASAALTVWIGQKAYWRSPVAALFSVGEQRATSRSNPEFPITGMASLSLPLILHPDCSFHTEVDAPGFYPEAPLRMWAVLQGKHARGI